MNGRLHFTNMDGTNAPYRVFGSYPTDNSAIAYLVQGIGMSGRLYQNLANRLADLGYSVIMPLQPGCFGAPIPATLTNSEIATWNWRWFDHTFATSSQVLLIGHSLGACTAIEMCAQRPKQVARIITLNAVGGDVWRTRKRKNKTTVSINQRPRRSWLAAFARELFTRGGPTASVAMGTDFVTNIVRQPRSMWAITEMARQVDATATARTLVDLGIPVDTLWSKDDWFVGRHTREAFLRATGDAVTTCHEVSGAHGTGVMHAGEVIKALLPQLQDTLSDLRPLPSSS